MPLLKKINKLFVFLIFGVSAIGCFLKHEKYTSFHVYKFGLRFHKFQYVPNLIWDTQNNLFGKTAQTPESINIYAQVQTLQEYNTYKESVKMS